MRLVAVEQFQVQVAARFVGETLEKFPREAETKPAGDVLMLFRIGDFLGEFVQPAPDEEWPAAEIHDAAGETFIHRHIGFAGEWVFRVETVAIAADAALVAEGGGDGLPERDAAILDGVMRVHCQIAMANEFQIHRRVLGEQRQHMVEERKAGADFGFTLAVEVEAEGNLGFQSVAFDFGRARFHRAD